MRTTALIYSLTWMILFQLMGDQTLIGQSTWDWRDPNDLGIVDFGDNKVLGYNLLGLGAIMIFDKKAQKDSTRISQISVGWYQEYKREPISQLWIGEYRLGKYLRPYISWGGGIRSYGIVGEGVKTLGFGGYLWFTWHIIRGRRWTLSYDNGVGPNYFFRAFPDGGTRFNFTTQYGIVVGHNIGHHRLTLHFTNIHISNAGILGPNRNPALDAYGIKIGWSF